MRAGRVVHLIFDPAVFFWLAMLCIFSSGESRRLWRQLADPGGFALGLALGLVVYYGTAALVFRRFPRAGEYLQEIVRSFSSARPPARRMLRLGGRALYEEAFWRGTLQVLLGGGAAAVLATAALFTLRHCYLCRRNRRQLTAAVLLELSLFSLLLGVLYHLSDRLLLVVGVHLVRNLLLAASCSFPGREPAPLRRVEARA